MINGLIAAATSLIAIAAIFVGINAAVQSYAIQNHVFNASWLSEEVASVLENPKACEENFSGNSLNTNAKDVIPLTLNGSLNTKIVDGTYKGIGKVKLGVEPIRRLGDIVEANLVLETMSRSGMQISREYAVILEVVGSNPAQITGCKVGYPHDNLHYGEKCPADLVLVGFEADGSPLCQLGTRGPPGPAGPAYGGDEPAQCTVGDASAKKLEKEAEEAEKNGLPPPVYLCATGKGTTADNPNFHVNLEDVEYISPKPAVCEGYLPLNNKDLDYCAKYYSD